MTANTSIDPSAFLHEQLAQASPDLMRELLGTFINALLSAQADRCAAPSTAPAAMSAPTGATGTVTVTSTPAPAPLDVAVPKLREGTLLPGLAPGAAPAGGGGADDGGRDLLPARRLHPPDGQTRPDPRDHRPVQVAGVGDGARTSTSRSPRSAPGRCMTARTRSSRRTR